MMGTVMENEQKQGLTLVISGLKQIRMIFQHSVFMNIVWLLGLLLKL